MAGDYSRTTFVKNKHYSGVLMQQGRVQLDADWNEQWQIEQHRIMTEATDVIGHSGVPKKGGGFKIGTTADGSDLTISPGRIYVDGLLCELEKTIIPTTYFNQPYYPDPDSTNFNLNQLPGSQSQTAGSPPDSPLSSPPDSPPASPPSPSGLKDGVYLVYLDAWQQEINFHDDPHIHEVALGEADTTTRMQNVWQVKLWKAPDATGTTCKTSFPDWDAFIAAPTGKLNAKVTTVTDPTNPCQLPPTSGYRGLENQLYRVEVQKGGTAASGTFKWSRDNATVETLIDHIDNTTVTVADLGRDKESLGFAFGQWVEIVDEESTLQNSPNPLVTIKKIEQGSDGINVVVSDAVGQYDGLPGLKLRRWDQSAKATEDGVQMKGGWIELENGIEVFFGDGTYRAGDYWLIPARTATGDIEWPPYSNPEASPIPQSPAGIRHYHCRLAILEVSNGVVTPQDCRHKFPALTEIDASDVWFNNNTCNLAGAVNVQEALDLLCAANEMRDHNKFLHGYGVVCGLKVVCGYQRQTVTVESGYALDCNGNVVRIKDPNGVPYAIVEESRQFLTPEGNGAVSIILNSTTGSPTFSVEKYIKKTFWEEVLEGTLLKDFYDDSIGKLLMFGSTQFGSLTPVAPVPIGQRKLTSLLNLLSQIFNSASGPYAFLSGVQGMRSMNDCTENSDEKKYEDKLLWCLYKDLRNLLASETFCGMFDGDNAFPDYNIQQGLQTIFGPVLQTHTRLQVSPDGKYAYTAGDANTIYMYDLTALELLNILTFPGSTSIAIQDIAISPDGTELAVVAILNNLDSYFAVAAIGTGGTVTWGATSVSCGTQYARLAYSPATPPLTPTSPPLPPTTTGLQLYGTVPTKGLFQISAIGTPNFTTTQVGPTFNATGLFTFSNPGGQYVFAAISERTGVQSSFDHIISFPTSGQPFPGGPAFTTIAYIGVDADNDLLYYRKSLFVTGQNPSGATSRALGVSLNINPALNTNVFQTVSLSDSSTLRLAGVKNYLLITYSDACKAVRFNLNWLGGESLFKQNGRIPVQLFPMAIAVTADGSTGYVLNSVINTITAINFSQVFNTTSPPDYIIDPPTTTDSINAYRQKVIAAYTDLFGHLLQFLKDSFCDRFLIDCPTCTGKEKIYLGTVEIRKGRVYKICNFRKRKYVKTFRTVGYWLSTVPILPVVKESLTKFCCAVIGSTTKKSGNTIT